MANASQLFQDDEEERLGNSPSDDELRHITGIGPEAEGAMDDQAKAGAADDLVNQERNAGSNSGGSSSADDKGIGASGLASAEAEGGGADQLGNGFNPMAGGRPSAKNFFWGSTRRKRTTVAGGITGGIVGVVMAFAGFASGPFQLIHMGQLLAHNLSKVQSDSEDRSNHLLRYAKAYRNKDFRYTRVGPIAVRSMNKAVSAFEEAGVKFAGNDALGRPTRVTIDRTIVEKNFPETKSMNDAEMKSWLNEKFKTTGFEGTGRDIHLDIKGVKSAALRGLISDARVSFIGDGKVMGAMKTRSMKKFFGLNSLFHPFSRAIEDRIAVRVAAAQEARRAGQTPQESPEQIATKAEQEVRVAQRSGVEVPGEVKFAEVKKASNGPFASVASKTGGLVGWTWVTGCVLKGAGDGIVVMNRSLTVVPAALEATSVMSTAEATKYGGTDTGIHQVEGMVSGFKGKDGSSAWQAPAIMTLEGKSASSMAKNPDGSIVNDLSGDYKQSFGDQNTAEKFRSTGDMLLNFIPIPPPVDKCGVVAGVVVVVAGLAYQGVKLVSAAGTDGGSLVVFALLSRGAEEAVKFYLGAQMIGYITNKIIHANTPPKLPADAFSGLQGGNLLAYGARAAGNITAIGSGGLPLNNNSSTIIGSAGEDEKQQFRSKSYFARTFDIYDYRSLTGRLSMTIKPTFRGNALLLVSGMQNMGSTLMHNFSSLVPGVSAAGADNSWSGDFDWGFPQFGIPDNMLKDPGLDDPYLNLEDVGAYFNGVCVTKDKDGNITHTGPEDGACAGDSGYTSRVVKCFGNTLSYDGGVSNGRWDVSPATGADVDPNSETYQGAHCGTIQDNSWKKIVMFVNDTINVKSIDCYDGDNDTSEQSCIDIGVSSQGTNTATSGGSGPSVPTGGDSSNMTCSAGTNKGIADGYQDGLLYKIRLCEVQGITVNAQIAGNVDRLVSAAHGAGLGIGGSGFRSMEGQIEARRNNGCPDIYNSPSKTCRVPTARPGYSNHQMGLAIDFNGGSGRSICFPSPSSACHGNALFDWLQNNAATYGLKNLPSEAWHWSIDGK